MELALRITGAVADLGGIGLIVYLYSQLRAAEKWIDEIVDELEKKQ